MVRVTVKIVRDVLRRAGSQALGMSFHTGFASALCVSAFQPLLSRVLVGSIDWRATASLYAIVWAAYLLDRLLAQPEDQATVGPHSAAVVRRWSALFWSLLAALGCFELVLLVQTPWLWRSMAVALTVSVLYSVPIPLLRVRAKTVPYFKAVYLPFSSVVTVVAFTPAILDRDPWRSAPWLLVTFVLYVLNYSLFDVKDIEGDRLANIKTLAAALGVGRLVGAQVAIALSVAIGAVTWLGPRLAWPVGGVALFHAGTSLRLLRRPMTPALCGIVDLGYSVILGLGAVLVPPAV
jgi:4-hydroxybenzoate polyprenyltransferase